MKKIVGLKLIKKIRGTKTKILNIYRDQKNIFNL